MVLTLNNQTDSPVHQAHRLASKLSDYKQANALVMATSCDSIALATELARALELKYERHYCLALKHPGNPLKTIGSITDDNVVLDNQLLSLPRDYIQHQIALVRHAVHQDQESEHKPHSEDLSILVREAIHNPNELLALVESVKFRGAKSVIIATPKIQRDALSLLESQVESVVYLDLDHHAGNWLQPF